MDTNKFYGPHTRGNICFIISVDIPDGGNVSDIGDTDDDICDDPYGGTPPLGCAPSLSSSTVSPCPWGTVVSPSIGQCILLSI